MFSFFKKEANYQLLAPMSGAIASITAASDPVFAGKMVGDGVVITASSDNVVAPCDGVISFIADSKHAFAMVLENGVEVLVHIGLDTVKLQGKGFTQLIKQGSKVKAGTPIISIERHVILEKGISLVSPVIITNPEILKSIVCNIGIEAVAGKTVILEYTL